MREDGWWKIGRVQAGWIVFVVAFGSSSFFFHTKRLDGWLPFLACLSGSLFAAVLIVYLAERLLGVESRRPGAWEGQRD